MEKKQGFFSALKDEVVRGLSPSRSRGSSPARARSASPISALLRRKKSGGQCNSAQPETALIARSGSLRPLGEALAPLMEGPDPDGGDAGDSKRVGSGLGQWMRGQLSRAPSMAYRRSDLRILLGVMGAPLAPVHVSSNDPLPHLSIKDTPILLSAWLVQDIMSGVEDTSEQIMPSQNEEEAAVKKKYGGIMPKKPPLISKDHERAYFDSADWALGKQGVEKPKGPLEALRPKLQPTQQQTRYRKSPCAPADGEDGGSDPSEDTTANE